MRAVLSRDVALIAKSIDVASATAVLAESPSTTPSRCGATPKVANGMAGAPGQRRRHRPVEVAGPQPKYERLKPTTHADQPP